MCRGAFRSYSCFRIVTCPTEEGKGERMFYNDYYQELAKERMRAAIEEREHVNLVKQVRLAGRAPRGGMFARSAAFVTALFRASRGRAPTTT